MPTPPRGLPVRAYLPAVLIFAIVLLGLVGYLVGQAFGVTGSLFGKSGASPAGAAAQAANTNVEGGAPPAVIEQLRALRKLIAEHPNDDIALAEMGDNYLTVAKYADAIPFYKRALRANPKNVAAKAGLEEALSGLASQNNP